MQSVTRRPRLQAYQARGAFVLRSLLRLLALLPIALRLEWLRWLRDEVQLNPAHPGLAELTLEIRELEARHGLRARSPRPIALARGAWVSLVGRCA